MTRDTMRILAQDRLISNNTRTTKLNNNDLIIGPTGAGKTRNYVKPNLLQYALEGGCSLIIADTKGSLVEEVGPVMAAHGYKVINLDFINLMNNSVGYNPLDFVSCDPAQKGYSEQEILTISSALVPIETKRDPFWEQSAQIFLSAFDRLRAGDPAPGGAHPGGGGPALPEPEPARLRREQKHGGHDPVPGAGREEAGQRRLAELPDGVQNRPVRKDIRLYRDVPDQQAGLPVPARGQAAV